MPKIHHLLGALALAAATCGSAVAAAPAPINVKIIGLGDFHGNLESPGTFGANTTIPSAQRPAVGGADYVAAFVARMKAASPNHAVVGGGDLIGASPIVSAQFFDEPAVETLNKIGLEFAAAGEHEFDNGKDELRRRQNGGCKLTNAQADPNSCKGFGSTVPGMYDGAKYRWLSANGVEAATSRTLLPPYGVKVFNGVRVAFVGITPTPISVAGLQFKGEVETVNKLVPQLRALGIEAIVVLLHQGGYQSGSGNANGINGCLGDLKNADGSESQIRKIVAGLDNAVDLVISGHTHAAYNCSANTVDVTGVTHSGVAVSTPRPTGLPNKAGRLVPVTSASAFGRLLTEIDLTINPATRDITAVSANNRLVDRADAAATAWVAANPEISNVVASYRTAMPWTRYLGAHYTTTPVSGLTRPWAGGGVRDPGGSYRPVLSGGIYLDDGYAVFTSRALPLINTLLGEGKPAVLLAGGGSTSGASVFFNSMLTPAGRDAYKKSISDRVDQIAALSNANGWDKKIYFQFGNEISNPASTGYYGSVCLWITRNDPTPVASCDLTTQFIPTYVEYYLAPGIAHLEAKSQALFGRPDALHAMLGSIVNLSSREAFVDALLNYKIVGTYATAYANRYVSDVVDTVSIHYTVTTSTWRTTLDNFRNKYLPAGVPTTRVRALWATEEGGVRSAEQGYGMASALRGMARYLSWWQANKISPDDGHVFYWGTDVNKPSNGVCTGCTSVDQDMPILHNFVGDNALTELSSGKSTFGAAGNFESYEFAVGGQDKRVLIGFEPRNDGSTTTLSSLALNLAPWAGRTVSISALRFSNQGPQAIAVTPASLIAGPNVSVAVAATLTGFDAVLFFVEAQR